ncbi:MAG TPA: glycosyltransferase family 87 protein [Rhizomicrobium sp.]|nr:glycosyltransferase family 87 protein [Rhizomicrobium sp.]
MSDLVHSARLPGESLDLAKLATLEQRGGATHPTQTASGAPLDFGKVMSMLACAMALAYVAYLGIMYRSHDWILDVHGRPSITDFLVFWLAGKTALHGAGAAAYDPAIQHAMQSAAAGHPFTGQLPWRYSPIFFFIVAPLAVVPYLPAFIIWVSGSLAALGTALWRIARSPAGMLLAWSTPAVFINSICGQNGPLTAALLGGALLCLEKRPVLSGIFMALLTYKPQFGILLPAVLIVGGHWRALIAATLACVAVTLASCLVFGFDSLRAFLHFLPITSNTLLIHGENGFNKIQTLYGLMRWLHFGNAAGWIAQSIVGTAAAAACLWLWKRDVPYSLKAAGLASAVLLATPHLFPYDFAVLMVSFAFLYRHRAFDNLEIVGITVANFCIGAFLFFPTPIGLVAIAVTVALITRRVFQADAQRKTPVIACA